MLGSWMAPMFVLSTFDGWSLAQWVFDGIVSLILWYVAKKNREIEKLREELKKSNDKQIAEKFEAQKREMTTHMEPMLKRIDEIVEQLKSLDEDGESLGERNHKLELKFANNLAELNVQIRERMATHDDLLRHETSMSKKVDSIELRMGQMATAIARLAERVNRNG